MVGDLSPWARLQRSRKFWLMVSDAVASIVLYMAGRYFPALADDVKFLIMVLQPVVAVLIFSIAYEDAAASRVAHE